MRNIVDMRRRGGKVIVINPMRELGLVNFRVPSDVRSLLFGSRTSDLYVQPHIGGDLALLTGLAKRVVEHLDAFARRLGRNAVGDADRPVVVDPAVSQCLGPRIHRGDGQGRTDERGRQRSGELHGGSSPVVRTSP
jgi:hypothetical protein